MQSVLSCHQPLSAVTIVCLGLNVLTHWSLGDAALILNQWFSIHIKHSYLMHFPWNCPHMNARRPHWRLVNIVSGNDLVLNHYPGQRWPRCRPKVDPVVGHSELTGVCYSLTKLHFVTMIREISGWQWLAKKRKRKKENAVCRNTQLCPREITMS